MHAHTITTCARTHTHTHTHTRTHTPAQPAALRGVEQMGPSTIKDLTQVDTTHQLHTPHLQLKLQSYNGRMPVLFKWGAVGARSTAAGGVVGGLTETAH